MGVGEDEALGESISVTIIATGFDVNQQNNINNIEPIKVVHALGEEKLITQDLIEKDIKSNEPIDDEIFQSKVYDLVEDIEKSNTDAADLIPTTEDIKSIDVDFDESFELIDSDDFIINEVNISQDEI